MKLSKQDEHLAYESHFYLHDGYTGWAYGTPHNPMRISDDDGLLILEFLKRKEGKDYSEECQKTFPPVQYAEEETKEYTATHENRFIFRGNLTECAVEKKKLIKIEHEIDREVFKQ